MKQKFNIEMANGKRYFVEYDKLGKSRAIFDADGKRVYDNNICIIINYLKTDGIFL